jgi:DnaJ-class molecular chaperone
MDFIDFYQVLGIDKDADGAAIKAAYRKLARTHHPDLNPGDLKAEENFQKINQAYEVLKDKEERLKYDEIYDYVKSGGRPVSGPDHGSDQGQAQEAYADIFEQIFGQGRRQSRATPRRGQDIHAEVEIELQELLDSVTRSLSLQREETCVQCGGTGVSQGTICHRCRGLGRSIETSTLDVKIPKGMTEGSTIRLKGQGEAGLVNGPRGDLLLKIRLKPNQTWEVDGHNLKTDVPLSIFDAILGGKVDVVTPRGKLGVKIPAGSQNGTVMRLSGQGLPRTGEQKAGDLYIRLLPQIPTNLNDEQRSKFQDLREELKMTGSKP